jgi:hypothetical protein
MDSVSSLASTWRDDSSMQIPHVCAVDQIQLVWRGADWAKEAAEAWRSSSGHAITRPLQERASSSCLVFSQWLWRR